MASANVLNITDADFKHQVLESDVPVLLDFTAVWCGPCKAIAPLLDQVADAQKGKLKVCKIDIDQNTATPNQFGVQSIPTLILFKNGQMFERKVGSMSKTALDSFVAKVL
ncbi:MAG: thioredoxin [Pseudomonadota bacterium]|nr:thioredoxin [Pseudomonadota bacterium]